MTHTARRTPTANSMSKQPNEIEYSYRDVGEG